MLTSAFKPGEEIVVRRRAKVSLLQYIPCVVIYSFLLHLAFTDRESTRECFKHFFPLAVMTLQGSRETKKKNPTLQCIEFQREIKVEYSAYPLGSKIRNILQLVISSFLIPD